MGRPVKGILSTYPESLRKQIKNWREAHPGWGAKTIKAEFHASQSWQNEAIPSVASIARYLKQEGLTRSYERHRDLPQMPVQAEFRSHKLWEMDAKGYQKVEDIGYVSLINLNDRGSHTRLLSYPCWVGRECWQRHPDTEDYQCSLRLAFSRWGLPQAIQVDHGSVFIDNKSKSPFPTRLHLWLLSLGINLQFGRTGQPRDQAMTERSHQLWDAQCLQGQAYQDWQHLYHSLQTRRDFLNQHLGCRSLANQAPLQAKPDAQHSGRSYRPEWEQDLLDLTPVWHYLQQGLWYRKVAQAGTITLAQQVYYVGHTYAKQQVEITFDLASKCLLIHDSKGHWIRDCPIQGITIPTLMGQLAHHFNLPAFQLALPFEGNPHSVIRLFDTMGA